MATGILNGFAQLPLRTANLQLPKQLHARHCVQPV